MGEEYKASNVAMERTNVLALRISGLDEAIRMLKPEESANILAETAALVKNQVEKYGGRMMGGPGEVMLVLFGAGADAPLDAALAVTTSFAGFIASRHNDLSLAIAAGLAAGDALIGTVDFNAVPVEVGAGGPVRIAVMLALRARGGQLLADKEAYLAAPDSAKFWIADPLQTGDGGNLPPVYELKTGQEHGAPARLEYLPRDVQGRDEIARLSEAYAAGRWNDIFDEQTALHYAGMGEQGYASFYAKIHGYIAVQRGEFDTVRKILRVLALIGREHDSGAARSDLLELQSYYFFVRRDIINARSALDKAAGYAGSGGEGGRKIIYYGIGSVLERYVDNHGAAEEYLLKARSLAESAGWISPYLARFIHLAEYHHILRKIQIASAMGGGDVRALRGEAMGVLGPALRHARSFMPDRPLFYRNAAALYWIFARQKRALRFLSASLAEAGKLGAGVDLARTRMEAGRLLLDISSRYRELGGVRGEKYLETAKQAFEEWDLRWDLENMGKLAVGRMGH